MKGESRFCRGWTNRLLIVCLSHGSSDQQLETHTFKTPAFEDELTTLGHAKWLGGSIHPVFGIRQVHLSKS